jgi:hypothetical protein
LEGKTMKMNKSTRHAKITGDFGEALILYWLSKFGFECAAVDHTGIDIIANNPHTKEIMGISVKTRSRSEGKETESVTIPIDNFDKAEAACKAFGCKPYFAVVVDGSERIRCFLLPIKRLLAICPKQKVGSYWKMTKRFLDQYLQDPDIQSFEFFTNTVKWWSD